MSDSENNRSATRVPPRLLFVRLLRLFMTITGVGSTLFGIVFLITTIAFAKKEEFFFRGELYGGIAFLVCGMALLTWVRRRLSNEIRSAALREADRDDVGLSVPPRTEVVGVSLIAVSLILPVLAGVVLLFVTSFGIALAISAATVLASSVLVAFDARSLGNVDLQGRQRESAGVLFLGMCLLWIIVYPFAFFRRQHFAGPNLGLVAVAVALFFGAGPFIGSVVIPPRLPSCSSSEVVQLLEQVIRSTHVNATLKSIDGHRELSFDSDASARHGECVAHTDSGDVLVNFLVEWQDRSKGLFQVRILPADLPSCTGPEVAELLDKVIRTTLVGGTLTSIDGHRELSYDRDAGVRHGASVAHTDAGNIDVQFVVEWQDRNKGVFQVRIPPAHLPSCTGPEVAELLEQVIRSTLVGAKLKSIDGHREISYDLAAGVRNGECLARTDAGEIPIKFIVEWQDRDKGLFQVRTVATPE